MADALSRFVARMDAAVASSEDAATCAAAAAEHLVDLLEHPEAIGPEHRVAAAECYQQHVVHVHPEGRYSLVSLVWRPGQQTPIHDHHCWCVVGVLEGEEDEERFHLVEQDDRPALVLVGSERQAAGGICQLVPPQENIHRVSSAAPTGVTVSLHVYGDDIARLGSSINQTFDVAMVVDDASGVSGAERPVSWRQRA